MNFIDKITDTISDHQQMIKRILTNHELVKEIEHGVSVIAESLCNGGTIFAFGNGGSAADAQHIVSELVGRYFLERNGLRAIALSTDGSTMTSLANDFGYDEIFSRQLDALGHPGDVALAISTSGQSPNIIKGIETAKAKGMQVIGFTGQNGRSMASLCDATILIPSQETPRIQEGHVLVYHIICGLVEQAVCLWKEN